MKMENGKQRQPLGQRDDIVNRCRYKCSLLVAHAQDYVYLLETRFVKLSVLNENSCISKSRANEPHYDFLQSVSLCCVSSVLRADSMCE